jgi:hypothetical protein
MPQPAEAEQRPRPFLGRRLHFERRAAVADHDLAREGKAAGIDLVGAGGVGGAQILRRDQKPIGLEREDRPAQQWMTVEATGSPPQSAAQQQPRQFCMVRD